MIEIQVLDGDGIDHRWDHLLYGDGFGDAEVFIDDTVDENGDDRGGGRGDGREEDSWNDWNNWNDGDGAGNGWNGENGDGGGYLFFDESNPGLQDA